jgi:hypothetical protein
MVMNASGQIVTYGGVNTAGGGLPAFRADAYVSGATGAQSSIASFTPATGIHQFEVSCFINVTTGTADVFTCSVSYTDDAGNAGSDTIASATLNATGHFGAIIPIITSGANAIICKTSGTFTTTVYNVGCWIKQTN